jgi:Rieske Fe-S protein
VHAPGCDVSKVRRRLISCPCHGSKFSIETGEPTDRAGHQALAETKVKVDGDNIRQGLSDDRPEVRRRGAATDLRSGNHVSPPH